MRAEIGHQGHLTLGAATGHGHDGAAEPLGAVVEAEPAGEQAVAVGVVDDVAGARAGAGERPRHQAGPQVEIAARVADDRRLAGGAGRGVEAQHVLLRHREQAKGIVVTQVGLSGERKVRDVAERGDTRRADAGCIELSPQRRDPRIGALNARLEPRELERGELAARHRLGGGIEHG